MARVATTPTAALLLGDCRQELAKIADDSVDLIVTSPPYANQRASTYGGVKPADYVAWFLPVADELYRVLKPSGTFILNIKEPAVSGERHTHVIELILAMRRQGWLWTEEFVWHKKNCYPGKWPNRFRDAWERLLQFNKQRKFKMNQESVMVPVGDWYDNRMRNLSETDRVRDESKVGSGFGKKVENWLGRDLVYPTNVLHRARNAATATTAPFSPTGCRNGSLTCSPTPATPCLTHSSAPAPRHLPRWTKGAMSSALRCTNPTTTS